METDRSSGSGDKSQSAGKLWSVRATQVFNPAGLQPTLTPFQSEMKTKRSSSSSSSVVSASSTPVVGTTGDQDNEGVGDRRAKVVPERTWTFHDTNEFQQRPKLAAPEAAQNDNNEDHSENSSRGAVAAVVDAGQGVIICAAFSTDTAIAAARAWCAQVVAAVTTGAACPSASSDGGIEARHLSATVVRLQFIFKIRLGGRSCSEKRIHRAKEQLTRALLQPQVQEGRAAQELTEVSSGGKFSQVTVLHLLTDKENERTLSVLWSFACGRKS